MRVAVATKDEKKQQQADDKSALKSVSAKGKVSQNGKRAAKRNYTLRLPEDLKRKVVAVSEAHGVTEAAVIRRACEAYITQVQSENTLAVIEERVAATLSRAHSIAAKANRLAEKSHRDVQILTAAVDELARFIFKTQPEIVNQDAANTLQSGRYKNFTDRLGSAFVQAGRMSRLGASVVMHLGEENDESGSSEVQQEFSSEE